MKGKTKPIVVLRNKDGDLFLREDNIFQDKTTNKEMLEILIHGPFVEENELREYVMNETELSKNELDNAISKGYMLLLDEEYNMATGNQYRKIWAVITKEVASEDIHANQLTTALVLDELYNIIKSIQAGFEDNVFCALVGGWAVYHHGYERRTKDIDILVGIDKKVPNLNNKLEKFRRYIEQKIKTKYNLKEEDIESHPPSNNMEESFKNAIIKFIRPAKDGFEHEIGIDILFAYHDYEFDGL